MHPKRRLVPQSLLLLVFLIAVGCGQSAGTDATDGGDARSSGGFFLCEGSPVPFCKPTCGANESAGEGTCATGNVCCYPHRDAGVPANRDAGDADAGDAADALTE